MTRDDLRKSTIKCIFNAPLMHMHCISFETDKILSVKSMKSVELSNAVSKDLNVIFICKNTSKIELQIMQKIKFKYNNESCDVATIQPNCMI